MKLLTGPGNSTVAYAQQWDEVSTLLHDDQPQPKSEMLECECGYGST